MEGLKDSAPIHVVSSPDQAAKFPWVISLGISV